MLDLIFLIIVYAIIFTGLILFLKSIINPDKIKTVKKSSFPKKPAKGILYILIGMVLMIFVGFMFL